MTSIREGKAFYVETLNGRRLFLWNPQSRYGGWTYSYYGREIYQVVKVDNRGMHEVHDCTREGDVGRGWLCTGGIQGVERIIRSWESERNNDAEFEAESHADACA